jgi:hypothetical protein
LLRNIKRILSGTVPCTESQNRGSDESFHLITKNQQEHEERPAVTTGQETLARFILHQRDFIVKSVKGGHMK